MFVCRLKLYIPWKFATASTIISGINYRYETPNVEANEADKALASPHKFDKCVYIVIRGVEWEISPKTRIRVNI